MIKLLLWDPVGWLVCHISGLTSDWESGSDQGPTIVVDFWAPFYALYECTALVNSWYITVYIVNKKWQAMAIMKNESKGAYIPPFSRLNLPARYG